MQFKRNMKKQSKAMFKAPLKAPVLGLVVQHRSLVDLNVVATRRARNDATFGIKGKIRLPKKVRGFNIFGSPNENEQPVSVADHLAQLDTPIVTAAVYPYKHFILASLFMALLILGSAMALVFEAHKIRGQVSYLAELQTQRDEYQLEWYRLILEQNTLTAFDRIESKAKYTGMSYPSPKDMVLVKSE